MTHFPHVQLLYSLWSDSIYNVDTLLYPYALPIEPYPIFYSNLCLSCNLSQAYSCNNISINTDFHIIYDISLKTI